jgi:hypothetical protein
MTYKQIAREASERAWMAFLANVSERELYAPASELAHVLRSQYRWHVREIKRRERLITDTPAH